MRLVPVLALACGVLALVAQPPTPTVAQVAQGFRLVGHSDLGARGMNAGLAIAGDCAYVGSRGPSQGVVIVDIHDPRQPRVAGALPHAAGDAPREVRADARLHLLVVLTSRLASGPAATNGLTLYDITACRAPRPVGRLDFGGDVPHEFFLWTDPAPTRPRRALAYVAMWGPVPNLRVVDLSDPGHPTLVATWDPSSAQGSTSRIHSLSVTPDGTRAYLADWDAGLLVLDTTALAHAVPHPVLTLLTPPAAWLQLAGGNLHSVVPIPGTHLLVTTQEIYGPGACPYGRLHVVDAADPARPRAVSAFGIPENDPATCATTELRDGAFTTHNPLVVDHLAFVSWYAGGLRAVDLRNPAAPVAAGAFVPEPIPAVAADDLSLGTDPVRMWSYPIIRAGLVYVVDIRNGLYVLRYTGPGAAAVAAIAFAQGNAT